MHANYILSIKFNKQITYACITDASQNFKGGAEQKGKRRKKEKQTYIRKNKQNKKKHQNEKL